MATPTYDPIASTTLASSASSVTFSSLDTIAAGYRDLVLVVEQTATGGNTSVGIRFNSDSGNNYAFVTMYGDGGTSGSSTQSSWPRIQVGGFSAYAANGETMTAVCNIMDYSATDKHKSVLSRANASDFAGAGPEATAARWANNTAVTTLEVFTGSNNYAAGSTFSLYGISA